MIAESIKEQWKNAYDKLKESLQQLLISVPTPYSNMASAEQAIKRYAKQGIITKFWQDTPKAGLTRR